MRPIGYIVYSYCIGGGKQDNIIVILCMCRVQRNMGTCPAPACLFSMGSCPARACHDPTVYREAWVAALHLRVMTLLCTGQHG